MKSSSHFWLNPINQFVFGGMLLLVLYLRKLWSPSFGIIAKRSKITRSLPIHFTGLDFIVRSIIHFELTSVNRTRYESKFIHLHTDVQLFQHHLWKRLFFSPLNLPWYLCQPSNNHYMWVPFWTLLSSSDRSISHHDYSVLIPIDL